ncbi:ANTAR domain-containing protein [Phytomonospora endophytica]|uniref:ANTAR domain-containing protein n=1 Tax=Phytomonospora endophytica TaxID=714109 RepID=A0A841FVA1_9ACTN|nr:ANTAR domain-containing protein [Phytomonospora endophytica]MBB6037267.1 hypothetical protein [Phytomonospora endophytica]GIG69989.1 transcription antitermination regulator [Phytomonospora endophytica]
MTEPVDAPDNALDKLSSTVSRLRKERDGLRRAMRNRAVIEQAKGILAERLSVSPEDAFTQLIELSTHSNVKLAELAAALVAGRSPELDPAAIEDIAGAEILTRFPQSATDVGGYATDLAENLAEPTARRRLLAGRVEAALNFDEIADAVAASTLGWPAPATVVLMLLDADGALRLAGASGLPSELRSRWSRVPPIEGLPMVEAVRLRRPVLITDSETLHHEFPATVAPRSVQGLAALPLIGEDSVLGVLEVFWERAHVLDDEGRANLLALAEPTARRCQELSSLQTFGGMEETTIGSSVLPLMLDVFVNPAVLLAPIYGGDDQIVDFRVEAAGIAARALGDIEGLSDAQGSLLTFLPHLGSRRLVPWLAEVAESGEPQGLDGLYADAAFEGTRHSYLFDLRAIRLWDRVLVTCRVRGDAELMHEQLVLSEIAGDAGSFRWDSLTGHTVWSPGLFRLLGRVEKDGPLPAGQVGELIDPDDLARLLVEIDDTLVKGRTLTAEVRGVGRIAGRRFALTVTPRLEEEALAGVAGTVRDMAGVAGGEERGRPGRAGAGSGRRRLDSRINELAARDGRLEAGGFSVGGLLAGPEAPVLDCWFDLLELPDGRVFLAVGETHGPDSALTGQRLRHAAVAYGLAGLTPGALLTALNALSARLEPGRTAAVTVAIVDGKNGTVAWAAAGQGALIRCPRGGTGQVVPGALGLPVGSAEGLDYTGNEAAVSVGDRLVLYTESLLTSGGVSPAEALGALLSCEHPEPEGILADLRERAVTGAEVALSLVAGTITGLSRRRARTR